MRARIEHIFTHMKWWNIPRNCGHERDGVHHATRGIALMHNLTITGCPGPRQPDHGGYPAALLQPLRDRLECIARVIVSAACRYAGLRSV